MHQVHDATATAAQCMDIVSTFQESCTQSHSNGTAAALQNSMRLFATISSSSPCLSGVILDRHLLDSTQRTDGSNLLTHILSADGTLHHLTGKELHTFHSQSCAALPDPKSLRAFLALRIQSHISGATIAVLFAAKKRPAAENWHTEQVDQKKEDISQHLHPLPPPRLPSPTLFQACEVQCFLQLASIASDKITVVSSQLELQDANTRNTKIQAAALQLEDNMLVVLQQHETLSEQLSTTTTEKTALTTQVAHLTTTCVEDAKKWQQQELVNESLLTLNVEDDTAAIVTTKLRTSLGHVLNVSPNACSVSLEKFKGIKGSERETFTGTSGDPGRGETAAIFSPYLLQPNKVFDSLQVVLEHKNVSLGHIATVRVSEKEGKHALLAIWVHSVNVFLFLWRQKMMTKEKERSIYKAEERVGIMLQSIENIKNKRDVLLQEKEETKVKVGQLMDTLETEKSERLRLEGQCQLLTEKNVHVSNAAVPASAREDPLTALIQLSSIEHVESETRVRLQRKCIDLEMKVERQEQELAQQRLLHDAAEKNALIKMTELSIALKRCQQKFAQQSERFQHVLRSSRNVLMQQEKLSSGSGVVGSVVR